MKKLNDPDHPLKMSQNSPGQNLLTEEILFSRIKEGRVGIVGTICRWEGIGVPVFLSRTQLLVGS